MVWDALLPDLSLVDYLCVAMLVLLSSLLPSTAPFSLSRRLPECSYAGTTVMSTLLPPTTLYYCQHYYPLLLSTLLPSTTLYYPLLLPSLSLW